MRIFLAFVAFFSSTFVFSQFQIGHTTVTFNDPTRTGGFGTGGGTGRQIQTEIYYPATTAGENAAVATGEFPVIVFGHGFAMSWDAYQNIWSHYAPMGYILAFPRTEGGLIPGPSHNDFGLDLRLVEQKLQVENTSASSLFYQKVKPNSAIMGHSMGGGATILAGANNTSIRTIIGLAPAETNPSAIAAAPNVSVPSLVFSGGQDGVTPPPDHHIPIYDGLGSFCKTFVNIVGGAHCYFANTNFNCDFGEATSSSGISISRTDQQTRTYSLLDPWLDYYLQGNCAAYDQFMNLLDDNPTTIIAESSCAVSSVPVISWGNGNLVSSMEGASYVWTLNGNVLPNATGMSIPPAGNGDYTVEVTAANGCVETSAPFSVTNTGIFELNNSIQVSPNPTEGLLVWSKPFSQKVRVDVFSSTGQWVMDAWVVDRLDIGALDNGIYLIRWENMVRRVVKK
jgi:pimeloyl-ACP methyl ester carboxylesterase